MTTSIDFILERNIEAARYVAKLGYSQMLEREYGIECRVDNSDKTYLEYKYRLDESVCVKKCS